MAKGNIATVNVTLNTKAMTTKVVELIVINNRLTPDTNDTNPGVNITSL